jgi:CRP-like cAMP-binding protein
MYYVSCNYEPEALQILSEEEYEFVKYENLGLNLSPQELIFKENAPVTYITFLFKGIIKLVKKTVHNKSEILKLLNGPCYVELSLLYGIHRYPYSAFAASEVKLCLIKRERFQKVFMENNRFAELIMKTIGETENATFLETQTLFRKQLSGRIASYLLYLSDTIFHNNNFHNPLNKTEMASFLGISGKSVFRVLAEFKNDGLIDYSGNHFSIVKRHILEKIGQNG